MNQLTDTTFDQALQETSGTLIVKFYANWCPDCRRIQRAYEGMPSEFPGLSFAELNTDENPVIAARYDVRGIPSFLVFRGGELVQRLYSRDAKSVGQVTDFVASQVG